MRQWTPDIGEESALSIAAALTAFHQRLDSHDVWNQASEDQRQEMWSTMLGMLYGDVVITAAMHGVTVEMVLEHKARTAIRLTAEAKAAGQ